MLSPDDRKAVFLEHFHQGESLYLEEKWHEAITQYAKCAEMKPKDYFILVRIGICHYHIGDYDASLMFFRQAVETNENYNNDAIKWLSYVARAANDVPTAINAYRLQLASGCDKDVSHARLGWALLVQARQLNDPALGNEALEHLKLVTALDPRDVDSQLNLGSTYQFLGNFKEATTVFRRALRAIDEDPQLYKDIGLNLASMGDLQGCLRAFEKAITTAPKDPVLRMGFADAYRWLKRFPEATQQYTLVLKSARADQPILADAFDRMGYCLVCLNRFEEAVIAYRSSIELAPDRGATRLRLSYAYQQLGEAEQAAAELALARELDPSLAPNWDSGRAN
jgi:tetratricopeptide (TPR) repeat protein